MDSPPGNETGPGKTQKGAYRNLLSQRKVSALLLASLVTRLPSSLLWLGLLLQVRASTGSYAEAGAAVAGYAIAFAIAMPITTRWAGQFRLAVVMSLCLLIYLVSAALLLLALAVGWPELVLVAITILLGASVPPAAPVIRGNWAAIVPAQDLNTIFASDAAINEAALMGGPLVVALLATLASPGYAIGAAGLLMSFGILLMLASKDLRHHKGPPTASRSIQSGPLAQRKARTLLMVAMCDTVAYGAVLVGVSAAATSRHVAGASGLLLAGYSAAIILGGLIYGARQRRSHQSRQLALFLGAGAALIAIAAFAPGLVVLSVLLVAFGSVGGPRDIVIQLMLGEIVLASQRTEAFAWLSSVMYVGFGVGTFVSGHFAGAGGGRQALAFAAIMTIFAAVWSMRIGDLSKIELG